MKTYSVYYPFATPPAAGTPVTVRRVNETADRDAYINRSWPVDGGYWADVTLRAGGQIYLDSCYLITVNHQ